MLDAWCAEEAGRVEQQRKQAVLNKRGRSHYVLESVSSRADGSDRGRRPESAPRVYLLCNSSPHGRLRERTTAGAFSLGVAIPRSAALVERGARILLRFAIVLHASAPALYADSQYRPAETTRRQQTKSCAEQDVTLRLTRKVVLPLTDSVTRGFRLRVEVNSDGRVFVGPTADYRDILVFDKHANFEGRLLGTMRPDRWDRDEGISTFRLADNDDLYVFSASAPNVISVDSRGAAKSTFALPAIAEDGIRLGGHIVMAGSVRTPERIGFPLHDIDVVSGRIQSFGTDRPTLTPLRPLLVDRVIAPAVGKTGVWSAMRNRLFIERWDAAGRRTTLIEGERDWLRAWEPIDSLRSWPPPRTSRGYVGAIREDDSGRVWMLTTVESDTTVLDNWRRARPRVGLPADSLHRSNDTVIHVMCGKTGKSIGELRADYFLTGFSRDGFVASRAERSSTIHIWQVELTPRPRVGRVAHD